MSEWKRYKLADIATLSNGINFDKSAYTSGVKLIGVADFKDRKYPDYSILQEVDSKVVRSGDYLEKGDIVFVRSNGNKELVGRCMMINSDIPVTYCEVNVPDRDTQIKMASVLSRYDSLIENYQKQIKLLEEAVQRLYKKWFVDLHFPGHESTKIVDGVPEGWENTNVNNILTFHRGYDLTHKEFVAGPYPVVGSTSIIGNHKRYKIEGPGIVTGRSGSLGVYQLIWDNYWPHNTSLYITVMEPPMSLQTKFSEIVMSMFKKQRHLQSQIRLLTEAHDRLLPKLMSGEIAV